jgi:hypothetical protein
MAPWEQQAIRTFLGRAKETASTPVRQAIESITAG